MAPLGPWAATNGQGHKAGSTTWSACWSRATWMKRQMASEQSRPMAKLESELRAAEEQASRWGSRCAWDGRGHGGTGAADRSRYRQ